MLCRWRYMSVMMIKWKHSSNVQDESDVTNISECRVCSNVVNKTERTIAENGHRKVMFDIIKDRVGEINLT